MKYFIEGTNFMDNKISPNNIESEQTLLGAMIIHKNTIQTPYKKLINIKLKV